MISLKSSVLVSLGAIALLLPQNATAADVPTTNGAHTFVAETFSNSSTHEIETKIYIKGAISRTEFPPGDSVNIANEQTGEFLELNADSHYATRELRAAQSFDVVAWLYNLPNVTKTAIGQKTFDGKQLDGFTGDFANIPGDHDLFPDGKFNLWIDPATNLPVRFCSLNDRGEESSGFINMCFDVPLDDSLFNLTPPTGYTVVDRGGLTAAQLKSPATTQQVAKLLLKPGVGIGDIRFGDTRQQIVAYLGEPEYTIDDYRAGWKQLYYPSWGFSLYLGPEGGLRKISACSAQASGINAHDFPGQTDRGIGIGSSGQALEKIYGQPDYTQPNRTNPNRFEIFPSLGMSIALHHGKISTMYLTAPGGQGIALPITPEAKQRATTMILKSGIGIDHLKLGATRQQAIDALGKPDDPNAGDLTYAAIGLTLNYDSQGHLQQIWAGIPRQLYNDGNPFLGKSDRGIQIGSTRQEVEQAYGKPDETQEPKRPVENISPSELYIYLNYNRLGMVVEIKGTTVSAIGVQAAVGPTTRPH